MFRSLGPVTCPLLREKIGGDLLVWGVVWGGEDPSPQHSPAGATTLTLTAHPTPGPDLKPPSPLKSPGKVNVYPSTNELNTLELYIFIPRSPKSQLPNFIHHQIPALSL